MHCMHAGERWVRWFVDSKYDFEKKRERERVVLLSRAATD